MGKNWAVWMYHLGGKNFANKFRREKNKGQEGCHTKKVQKKQMGGARGTGSKNNPENWDRLKLTRLREKKQTARPGEGRRGSRHEAEKKGGGKTGSRRGSEKKFYNWDEKIHSHPARRKKGKKDEKTRGV